MRFDPEAAIARLIREERFPRRRPWHTYLPVESGWLPTRLRETLLHGSVRSRLARASSFPRWPVESCVEDIRDLVWNAAERAGQAGSRAPFWPDGKACAAVLSHDLDSESIFRREDWRTLADLEESHGIRSSWHFCSSHLERAAPVLEELARRGHEIAWHGIRHDYRIAYMTPERLRKTMGSQQGVLRRFGVKGFRSPFYLRTPSLFEGLDGFFEYDSTCRDTAAEFASPFSREGCCTVFPFFRDRIVELPLTIPLDHDIAALTGDNAEEIYRIQSLKMDWIKKTGGLAVVLTHPLHWISLKPGALKAYEKLLRQLSGDPAAWVALARDVASWWRGRFAGTGARSPGT